MKIKFRNLLNPYILNDEKVGFQGNSEYEDENGKLRMGYWTFLDIIDIEDAHVNNHFTLDDEIEDYQLLNMIGWKVKNDNGTLCIVQFIYPDDEVEVENMEKITDAILDLQKKSIQTDFLKSNFIMCSECLMSCIFCLKNTDEVECNVTIMDYVNNLIESKEDLVLNLKELINHLELLDLELQDYMDQNLMEE